MAVPEQTPYIEHTGNGITTSFALKFQCESKDHLIVLVDEIEPPIATWSLTGGNVVFTTAPAAGKKITIQRNTPFNRTAEYQSFNNSFRPQTVNIDFDRIWLKLQELGVADWLMKLYVDRLHQQQEQKINDLKGYVDDRDDELRAYLLEEIRKQGVALDQLDEYYNYLMQRLAQIAVDKGWDASFVVDGDKTQHELNNLQKAINQSHQDFINNQLETNELRFPVFSVKAFGAKGDGVTDDRSAIQGAIDAATAANGGDVYWPSTTVGEYVVSSTNPDDPTCGLRYAPTGGIYVQGSVRFVGEGHWSRVVLKTASNITSLFNIATLANFVVFDTVYFDANKKANYALKADATPNPFMTVTKSRFRQGLEAAATIKSYVSDFNKSFFEASKKGLVYSGDGSGPATSTNFTSCYANSNSEVGFEFGYLTYCNLTACAVDDAPIAYRFGAAYGVNMSGCGCERVVNPLIVTGYRGFTINTFFMLSCGSADALNPANYLLEFKSGTNATVSGISNVNQRYANYVLASTSADFGSENITVTDRSVSRSQIYFIPNFAFARPIKLLRGDQTEKAVTYNLTNVAELRSTLLSLSGNFNIDHTTTITLAAGTYDVSLFLTVNGIGGVGELIVQGTSDRSQVRLIVGASNLGLTNISAKVRFKNLTLASNTTNASARRLSVDNCSNVVLDNVLLERGEVNTGYAVIANNGSNVSLINGTEATGSFAQKAFDAADTSKFIMDRRASAPTSGVWTAGMSFEYINPTTHRGAFYSGTAWVDYV